MQNLKIGDIKKFTETKNGKSTSFIGGVVDKQKWIITVLSSNGENKFFSLDDKSITYGITHLDPDFRKGFENVVKKTIEYIKRGHEIEKIKKENTELFSEIQKEFESLKSVQGILNRKDVAKTFDEFLKLYYPSLYFYLREYYDEDVSDSIDGIKIQYTYCDFITRWVKPNRYDFICEDYDRSLVIVSKETKDYKELYKKCSAKCANFTIEELEGKVNRHRGFGIGDRDTLYFQDSISITIPHNCLTEKYVEKLVKTIKVK